VGWGKAGCSAAGCGKTVVSGGDAPEALQPAEQPLDGVGLGRGVGPKQLFWRRLALDRTFASAPAGSIASRAAIRIEGAVGDPQGALGNRLDQRLATAEVGCLGAQGDKTRSACRPCSTQRGSWSSAHHPIAACRDGLPVRPMACARSPPFRARGALGRLRIGRSQRHIRRRAARPAGRAAVGPGEWFQGERFRASVFLTNVTNVAAAWGTAGRG
jgi:hypothetical protein